MVSKAKDDLPDPLNPVMTTNLSRGMVRLRFFRLCCRAPPILMNSLAMTLNFAISASHQHTPNHAKCKVRETRSVHRSMPPDLNRNLGPSMPRLPHLHRLKRRFV